MGNDGSKPAAGAPSAQQQMAATSAARARSIKLMDNSIRKKLRSTGIQYNMKVVLRGARGVGKSSLLSRLQGGKMPKVHAPTPSIRTATINWHFAKAREDAVKVEVWDVVDKALDDSKSTATVNRAEPGAHSLGALDASMVNVYSNADAIILVCSMADAATLEYVRRELARCPADVPVLVLATFRDRPAAEREFGEAEMRALLAAASDEPATAAAAAAETSPPQRRRLMMLECSLANCFGLDVLHSYLSVPFLTLKRRTVQANAGASEGLLAV